MAALYSVMLALTWACFFVWLRRQPTAMPVASREGCAPKRLAMLDNAKFLLMPTIVLTHTKWYAWPGVPVLMHFLNPWHVKTYAFISGLNSRKAPSERGFANLMFRLVLPNLLWCFTLYPFEYYLVRWKLPASFDELAEMWRSGFVNGRAGANWFLWGLIWWQLAGFFLQVFPRWLRMAVTVAATAAGGYLPADLFSFTMAISSLPIFVCGQVFPWDEVLARLPHGNREVFLGAVAFAVIVALESVPSWYEEFWNDIPAYGWSAGQPWYLWQAQMVPCTSVGAWMLWIRGAVFRNLLELTKSVIFLLFLVPRSESAMSTWGQRSLYAMLIHEPLMQLQLVIFAGEKNWSMWCPDPSSSWNIFVMVCLWLVVIAFSILLSIVLCSAPVQKLFWVIVEPTWAEQCVEASARFEERAEKCECLNSTGAEDESEDGSE